VEIISPDEASYAGRREDSGEGNGSAAMCETSGKYGGDVRTGLACVRTYQSVRRTMIAMEKLSDGTA
jgi:hypothetical protein